MTTCCYLQQVEAAAYEENSEDLEMLATLGQALVDVAESMTSPNVIVSNLPRATNIPILVRRVCEILCFGY